MRSDGQKKMRVTPSRGWHPSEINKSDSDEQKKVVSLSGKKDTVSQKTSTFYFSNNSVKN